MTAIRTLVAAVASLLFFCFLAEIAAFALLKWRGLETTGPLASRHLYSPYRGHELNPDYRSEYDTHGRRIHSPDGFRAEAPVSRAKPTGVFRIILMGASGAYGLGAAPRFPNAPSLANQETLGTVLEQTLNDTARPALRALGSERVEVINAAVTSYHAPQHLIYLNESLLDYQPDLLVFFEGHNDFYITSSEFRPRNYGYSTALLIPALNQRNLPVTLYALARFAAPYSFAFRLLERHALWAVEARERSGSDSELLLDPVGEDREGFAARYRSAAARNYLDAYEQMQVLGRRAGFDVLFFLEPEALLEDRERLSPEDQRRYDISRASMPKYAREAMLAIRTLLPGLFAQWGLAFHDSSALAAFAESPDRQLYLDYCHLTAEGTRLVATSGIAPRIVRYLGERRQARP